MRLSPLSAGLLLAMSACQAAGAGSTSSSQELSFVCTVATASGPVTQTVLSATDPGAIAAAGAAALLAAQLCAEIGGTPAAGAVQGTPAIQL